jgi:hypothetical protein
MSEHQDKRVQLDEQKKEVENEIEYALKINLYLI